MRARYRRARRRGKPAHPAPVASETAAWAVRSAVPADAAPTASTAPTAALADLAGRIRSRVSCGVRGLVSTTVRSALPRVQLIEPGVARIDVAQIAALEDLERTLDRPREAVASPVDVDRLEVPRGVEVGHRHAVDGIPDRLAGIADLEQVEQPDVRALGMRGCDQPVAEGIGDHLESLVPQRDAPRIGHLDEREGLARERVQVQSRQAVALEIVDERRFVLLPDGVLELAQELAGIAEEDDRAVIAGHVVEGLEDVHGRLEAPERCEVSRDLLLERRRRLEQVLDRDVAGERHDRDVVGEHVDSLQGAGS
jgi:hypothetical protein